MEGCSSMSPWTNIYQQGYDQEINTISNNNGNLISWNDQNPSNNDHFPTINPLIQCNNNINNNNNNNVTSSIDQSLDCLLSGSNSINTENSDEDDGISMLFSSNSSKNIWNFTSTALIAPTETTQKQNPTNKRSHNNNNLHTTPTPPPIVNNKRQKQLPAVQIPSASNNISFQNQGGKSSNPSVDEQDKEAIQQMKEMIYRAAAFRPVNFGIDPIERPKRKNVRISNDPQTAAARQRRERISERLRVLQKLVPGGTKMDTASMLDEAANYLKFLRNQVNDLETYGKNLNQFHFTTSNNNSNNSVFSNNPPRSMAFTMQLPYFLPQNPSFTHVHKS